MIRTPIKWLGGKQRIAKEVVSMFHPEHNNYFEPFLGGGSLFLTYLQEKQHERQFFLSDLNEDIIGWWRAVQSDVDSLLHELYFIKALYEHKADRKKNYQTIRSFFNLMSSYDARRAACFFFLVKTAFNGLARYNLKGDFNSAFGGLPNDHHGKSFMRTEFCVPEDDLRALSRLISRHDVVFNHVDFRSAEQPSADDFVVLDPPYLPFRGRKIDACSYNQEGFQLHDEVVEYCHKIDASGGYFLLCNHLTSGLEQEFGDEKYSILQRENMKTFSGKSSSRRNTVEVFVRNFS